MRKRRIIITFVILLLGCGIGLFVIHDNHKSDLDRILNSTMKAFQIETLNYDQVVYYYSSTPGPFGEGDSVLVAHIDAEFRQKFEDNLKLKNFVFSFPMNKEVKMFLNNRAENLDTDGRPGIIQDGYYGFYSKVTDQGLSQQELEAAVRQEEVISFA